jgi:hypothetical protein
MKNSKRLSADCLANKLLTSNDKCFWSEIKKLKNVNSSPIATTVNNVTGNHNIAQMWHSHFNELLNSSVDTVSKEYVLNELQSCDKQMFNRFTSSDVAECINMLKVGKSAGLDNLFGEHFKFAHHKLHVLLSLVFNAMIVHGFIPINFMDTLIILLVKNKKGNLSDKDNYRPLAITCIASKLLELLILNRYNNVLVTSDNQFGFKRNHSTDMCVFSLKQIIEYYVSLSSPVYVCFLDASKAFDKVNHWTLFMKLLDRKMPLIIVRLLLVWYRSQNFIIQWGNNLSDPFKVCNGVRQGGILSPFLFNLYIDKLSTLLSNLPIGCNLN